MSNEINVCWCLVSILSTRFIMSVVFFHWCRYVLVRMLLFILSKICLLICPISGLQGLIRRQLGLFMKLSLWSFSVMKASCSSIY